MRTIAVVNNKGGVGKSTTAVNLAWAAAELGGKRVLLVDMDGQASASTSLGIKRSDLSPSVLNALLGKSHISEVIRPTAHERLSLVTAEQDLYSLDTTLAGKPGRAGRLKAALEDLEEPYDLVFIDCPPTLNLLSVSALAACDAYLVPTEASYLSSQGLVGLFGAIERLKAGMGITPRLLGILLCMVDYRMRQTEHFVQLIREKYGKEVFTVPIPFNSKLKEAPSLGQSVFQYAPGSTGRRAYARLLDAFQEREALTA